MSLEIKQSEKKLEEACGEKRAAEQQCTDKRFVANCHSPFDFFFFLPFCCERLLNIYVGSRGNIMSERTVIEKQSFTNI